MKRIGAYRGGCDVLGSSRRTGAYTAEHPSFMARWVTTSDGESFWLRGPTAQAAQLVSRPLGRLDVRVSWPTATAASGEAKCWRITDLPSWHWFARSESEFGRQARSGVSVPRCGVDRVGADTGVGVRRICDAVVVDWRHRAEHRGAGTGADGWPSRWDLR